MTPVTPETLTAINTGISSEIASYVFYVEAIKKIDEPTIKEVLEKLALEEKEHFQILERQHQSLITSEMWISTADILKEKGLPEIDESMAYKHQILIDEVRNAQGLLPVLKIAYRLEEEAFTFFSSQIDKVDSIEAKKMYETLAKFEKGHMTMIQSLIDQQN